MTVNTVCIATYNGSRFLKEQVDSILAQLGQDDELIVVDDASMDDTVQMLEKFDDPRIRIFKNQQNIGVCGTFERAISLAEGDVIFLSDQDDIWLPNRLDIMRVELMKQNADMLVSNYSLVDEKGAIIDGQLVPPLQANHSRKRIRNLFGILAGRRNYYGCAMCFTSLFAKRASPFPKHANYHDLWFAIFANVNSRLVHFEEKTLHHRIHGSNVTVVDRPLLAKLNSRLEFILLIWKAFFWRS